MAIKRLAAVVAAIVLVVVSVAVRRWIDDGGELGLGGAQSTIYCDRAIAEACVDVFGPDVVVEAPGITLDRLLDASDVESTVWIAADVWFDIWVDEATRRNRDAVVADRRDGLVHTPVVLVGDVDGCVPLAWACIATADVDLGTTGLDDTVGLITQWQLAAGVLGRQDFGSNDPGFSSWQRQLDLDIAREPSDDALLGRFLNSPGTFDVIAVSAAAVEATGRGIDTVVPGDAGPDIEISALSFADARLPGRLDALATQLAERGWTNGGSAGVTGPSGGVLQALRGT